MAFTVTTYPSEEALQAGVSASAVQTLPDEETLENYINGLTTEVISQIVAKEGKFTVILDADVSPNTLIGIGAKGLKYTVVIQTP